MSTVADREQTVGRGFVALSAVGAVLVAAVLCLVLPAWADRVALTQSPVGAVTVGRLSVQPQPGWAEVVDERSGEPTRHLSKDGVLLTVATVPASAGTDPQPYLDALLDEFTLVADYEAVPFTTRTGDSGLIVLATGVDDAGAVATIVSRDGQEVALLPALGDPVSVSALFPEIGEMAGNARFRRSP